jgi:prevent-host-death family protein
MATMTISEARAALPEVLDRVCAGEDIVITRRGHPVAVVIDLDSWRHHRELPALADADRVEELLAAAAADPAPAQAGGLTAQRAEELVQAIRAGREQR